MRGDRAIPALLVALALVAGAARAGPTREDAEACAQPVERDEPIALEDSRCQAVTQAFRAQPGAADLKMGAEALRDWAMTLPAAPAAARHALPDPAAVGSILARLDQEQSSAPPSLWERFRRWVHSLFDPGQQRGRAPAWLIRLIDGLSRIPANAVRAAFWSGATILAAVLLWLVVVELRASGLLGGPPKQRRGAGAAQTALTGANAPVLSFDDIARLSADARAPALLQWLLQAFADRQLLTADRALTNGEVASRLPTEVANRFRRFVACLEPSLFGGRQLQEETFAEACALAHELAAGKVIQRPAQ